MKLSALRPLTGQAVVKVTVVENKTAEGFALAENDDDLVLYGEVVAVGTKPEDYEGMSVSAGDKIVFHALDVLTFHAIDAEEKSAEYGFVDFEDILAFYVE